MIQKTRDWLDEYEDNFDEHWHDFLKDDDDASARWFHKSMSLVDIMKLLNNGVDITDYVGNLKRG